jgi:hypothetical protein
MWKVARIAMINRCVDCGSHNVALVTGDLHPGKIKGGTAPYGFLAIDGEYEFDDESPRGERLVWMMQHHASGYSYRAIAQSLNAPPVAEAPSGGTWNHSSVRRVVMQGKRLSHLIPLGYVLGD